MRLFGPCMRSMLVVCLLGFKATAAAHGAVPSGLVSIATTSGVAGIGVNWGDGVLTTGGKRYTFAIQGLEIRGVDVSEVRVKGQVYHLKKVGDFEGTYVAEEADAARGGNPGPSPYEISMASKSRSTPSNKESS